jgi:hypothetical protein
MVSRLFTSQTGPLIRGKSGHSQVMRHSKPQWGHLYCFEPFGGVILFMQFIHLTCPVDRPLAVISAGVSFFKIIFYLFT